MERLTKFNHETNQYEYNGKAKTQAEFNEQRKAVIQKLGEYEDKEEGIANIATPTCDNCAFGCTYDQDEQPCCYCKDYGCWEKEEVDEQR